MRLIPIHVEQAVYGSFPFWDRGYAILARSAGCREEWVEEFRAACGRFGERPRDVEEVGGFFATRLRSGPWAVVGVGEVGRDDRGRPGALVFHAFFVQTGDYRRLGGWPFGLARYHRRDWGPGSGRLDPMVLDVEVASRSTSIDPRAARIAAAIARGRRVVVESARPIGELAREVWSALPARTRQRRSLATWAFGNANRFDLVGLPRREGVDLDASHMTLEDLAAQPMAGPMSLGSRGIGRWRAGLLAGLILLIVLVGFWWAARLGGERSDRHAETGAVVEVIATPPDRGHYRDDSLDGDPEIRARVAAGFVELASRFGLIEPGQGLGEPDANALMERIADQLRYRGPLLPAEALARLRSEPAAGRSRALAWDEHVRRFVPDRPLPPDFAQGPLRWQLETLAWSFHLALDPRTAPAEWPHALGHALAVEGSVRPNPLTEKYPALREYERFLSRLPRR